MRCCAGPGFEYAPELQLRAPQPAYISSIAASAAQQLHQLLAPRRLMAAALKGSPTPSMAHAGSHWLTSRFQGFVEGDFRGRSRLFRGNFGRCLKDK